MTGPQQIWNDQSQPLKEDEELDFDSSAYEMLHRSEVEWPCLSIDVLIRNRCGPQGIENKQKWFPSEMCGQLNKKDSVLNKRLNIEEHKKDKYPMTTYFCAGSQGENKNDNKIYVMKWSEMEKTINDDKQPDDNSEDDAEDIVEKMNSHIKEPIIRYESIPHRGCVNRIRSLHGTPIVATWNDEGEVGIYNIASAIEELDAPVPEEVLLSTNSKNKKKKKKNQAKKTYGGSKIGQFRHK